MTLSIPAQSIIKGSDLLVITTMINGLSQSGGASATSNLTVTATETDVPGAVFSVTMSGANGFALVTGDFDVLATVGTGNNVFQGRLTVDGTVQNGEAHTDDRQSRNTASHTWKVPLAAGSHTFKLRALASAGTFAVQTGHTGLAVVVFDLV